MKNLIKEVEPCGEKITWGELKKRAEEAGMQDNDEIDNITISWGSARDLDLKKDEIFGWQVYL